MTPMNEMTDDELDHLFIQSAEEMQVPFDPTAWKRMEQKLDQGVVKHKPIWMRWGWAGLALLLLGTVGVGVRLTQQSHTDKNTPITVEMGNSKVTVPTNTRTLQPAQSSTSKAETSAGEITGKEATDTQYILDKQATTAKEVGERKQQVESNNSHTLLETGGLKNYGQNQKNPLQKIIREEDPQPAMVVKNRTAESEDTEATSLSDAPGQKKDKDKLRRFFIQSKKTDQTQTHAENKSEPTQPELAMKHMGNGNIQTKQTSESVSETPKTVKPEVRKPSANKPEVNRQAVKKQSIADQSVVSQVVVTQVGVDVSHTETADQAEKSTTELSLQKTVVSYLSGRGIASKPSQMPVLTYTLTAVPEITPHTTNPWSRLGIRLVVAPDLTTVGFRNFTQPSTNVGVLLEYSIARRLVVSVGGIYAKKLYDAEGSAYNPPATYWTNRPDVDLVRVKADCRIIDIPITLRYNFIQRTQSAWFASVGASSYLMKREKYRYGYYTEKSYGKEYVERDWSIDNSNNHFLAVSNFSVGYERQFSRRFSWQVEPFVKVPLGGVGFGKVRLISSGVFFSLKYHPRMMR